MVKIKLPPTATAITAIAGTGAILTEKIPAVPPGLARISKKRALSLRTFIRRPLLTESLRSGLHTRHPPFRSPSEVHSVRPCSAAISPPAALCKNRIGTYSLFLIGLVHCSTAAYACQAGGGIYFYAFFAFTYSCMSGSASTNFSFICPFWGLMLISRSALGTSNWLPMLNGNLYMPSSGNS